jgi:hypothetical protein
MAIGIGLDHRPNPRVGGMAARHVQVMGQGLGVYGGLYRAGHGINTGLCCPDSDTARRAITAQHLAPHHNTHSIGNTDAAFPDP